MDQPKEFYNQRISEISEILKSLHRKINFIAFARLSSFAFIVASFFVYAGGIKFVALPMLFIFVILFFWLIKYHNSLKIFEKHTQKLLQINHNEIEYLNYNFSSFDSGDEYIDYKHPFSSDLDIFGTASLFQYINRTATNSGKSELAKIFSSPITDANDIIKRQNAVKEVSLKAIWRQEFQATGMKIESKSDDLDSLKNWLNEPTSFFSAKAVLILMVIVPVCCISSLIYGFISGIYGFADISFIILAAFYFSRMNRVNKIHNSLGLKHEILKSYSGLLLLIEREEFQSEILQNSRSILVKDRNSAAKQIMKLSKIVNRLDIRLNIFAGTLLNALYLSDFWCVFQLEKWKTANKNNLLPWLNAITTFDVYSSLGCFLYNQPSYVFPEFAKDSFEFETKEMGHPLIPDNKRICNDFILNHQGSFVILTGANMAGKSTFLRTIGINMVLGLAGAPVCASKFRFYPIPIMTGISIKDSLHDNESYFYAELKRLKMIVDELESGRSIFILLDEILKGTNSNDKIVGSKAILEKFIRFNAAGIIATHDVSLGDLEKLYPQNIKNHSFEVLLEGDMLYYDYKLHEGTCKNLNASFLMKKMGIISQ